MTEVIVTDEFKAWFGELSEDDDEAVSIVIGLLEERGVGLGYPHSSAIEGSKIALRELRAQSGGRPLRVFYKFDPKRRAVLLIAGDKTGDKRFYERMIPLAERLWGEYLDSMG